MGNHLTIASVVHLQFILCFWCVVFHRTVCMNPLLFFLFFVLCLHFLQCVLFVFVVKQCRVWLVFEYMITSKGHLLLANILVFQCFE